MKITSFFFVLFAFFVLKTFVFLCDGLSQSTSFSAFVQTLYPISQYDTSLFLVTQSVFFILHSSFCIYFGMMSTWPAFSFCDPPNVFRLAS